jgi:inosose dehydratase
VLRFVHIKDVDGKTLEDVRHRKLTFEEGIAEEVFTIVGEGSIDFPAFFRELLKMNYRGWMVIEQDVTFGATVIPPAESVAKGLRYLHGLVQKLAPAPAR